MRLTGATREVVRILEKTKLTHNDDNYDDDITYPSDAHPIDDRQREHARKATSSISPTERENNCVFGILAPFCNLVSTLVSTTTPTVYRGLIRLYFQTFSVNSYTPPTKLDTV